MKILKYLFIVIILSLLLFPVVMKNAESNIIFDNKLNNTDDTINQTEIYHEKIEEIPKETSFLFFGDIMTGRNVEKISQENNEYPFLNIKNLLNEKNDIIFANMEGPIDKNHIRTKTGSVSFSLPAYTAEILKNNSFNLLQLANNHLQDRGSYGFLNTQEVLKNNNIDFFGDYYNRNEFLSFEKEINNQKFIFIGINMINTECEKDSDLCIEDINNKAVKILENKEDYFSIIFIHWGNEYKLKSNTIQQSLAHKLIDSGIDLIVGGHPHVMQEVEKYNNKLIFYSLGNFVFDQYFSKETQQGYAIKFKNKDNKNFEFEIIPIEEIKSQPQIMSEENQKEFLNILVNNSSPELKEEILNKKIIINNESLK